MIIKSLTPLDIAIGALQSISTEWHAVNNGKRYRTLAAKRAREALTMMGEWIPPDRNEYSGDKSTNNNVKSGDEN